MKARLREIFARTDRQQLSRSDLIAAGLTTTVIRRAVKYGALREGVSGYWLPAPGDPGAAQVMQAAIAGKDF